MSGPKIEELLEWMKGKSHTQGWDALIVYDHQITNKLLTQVYLERYDKETHELPPISGSFNLGAYKEILNGLRFSAPRLSFENANLEQSWVTVTLDFIGGSIMTLFEDAGVARRINKIQSVLPLNSPQLSMRVELGGMGEVTDDGVVRLDLCGARDFKANFVIGDINQETAGTYFRQVFEGLEPEQKKYPLGSLGGENDHLKPKSFGLKTMAAPGATVKGSENFGSGAVLVFVEVEGGRAGNYPGASSGFMYPLPIDTNGEQYTGAVILGSLTLLSKLIKSDAEADIGHGIKLKPSTSNDIAATLTATEGSLFLEDCESYRWLSEGNSATLIADYNFRFADNTGPLTIAPDLDGIQLQWNTHIDTSYWYKNVRSILPDVVKTGTMWLTTSAQLHLDPSLSETGVVSFSKSFSDLQLNAKADEELKGFTDNDHNGNYWLNNNLHDAVDEYFEKFFDSITVPSVDTFLVRNILFPGYNMLRPAKVMLPGDLYMPGHLDPGRTAFGVLPLTSVIEAGAQHQFSTSVPVSGLTWSLRASAGDTDVGTIDATGLYKAPPSSAIPEGHKVVIATAKGKVGGVDVTASAMVMLLTSTITVSPIFQVCEPGTPVQLTAEALQGVVPNWSLQADKGGTLSTDTGNECVYTAGANGDEAIYVDTVLVKNPVTNSVTEAQMLVVNADLTEPFFISKDSQPETGKVQLHICDGGEHVTPDTWDGVCTVLYGPGTVSESGLYEAPAGATGYAVIHVKVPFRSGYSHGMLILPLPLDNARDYTPEAYCSPNRVERGPRKTPKDT